MLVQKLIHLISTKRTEELSVVTYVSGVKLIIFHQKLPILHRREPEGK